MTIDSFTDEYEFLSNFYEAPMTFESARYGMVHTRTVEHVYQAEKAISRHAFEYILAARTPALAKKRGKATKMIEGWDTLRYTVMWRALNAKFLQHPDLAKELLNTGQETLIEGNDWHDNVWGDCRCGAWRCRADGDNSLGILLMELRDNLRRR